MSLTFFSLPFWYQTHGPNIFSLPAIWQCETQDVDYAHAHIAHIFWYKYSRFQTCYCSYQSTMVFLLFGNVESTIPKIEGSVLTTSSASIWCCWFYLGRMCLCMGEGSPALSARMCLTLFKRHLFHLNNFLGILLWEAMSRTFISFGMSHKIVKSNSICNCSNPNLDSNAFIHRVAGFYRVDSLHISLSFQWRSIDFWRSINKWTIASGSR